MFSGIVEAMSQVTNIAKDKENITFTLSCEFASELKIDQSVAHNGVCLTVVEVEGGTYKVTAIQETLNKSNLGDIIVGDFVNVERSMQLNSLLDGHIVQGHVDTTATCSSIEEADGSWIFTFEYTSNDITVEKGSVTVNGVSLTVVNSRSKSFQVAIIPYTYEFTNFKHFKVGSKINLEFDIIGKYISKIMSRYLENKI